MVPSGSTCSPGWTRTTEKTPMPARSSRAACELRRAEAFTGMQQQPAADIVLVHRLQAGDADRADVGVRPLGRAKVHVQQLLGRPQVDRRQLDRRQRVARLANRRQQPLLRRQHIGRDRRRPRCQAKLVARRRRHVALDRDTAEVEQRSRLEVGCDRDRRVGGRPLQQIGQIGFVERPAVHGQRHLRRVIAEAGQRGLEAAGVVARPGDQRERTDRRLLAQRHQLRGVVQRLVQRGIAGRREGHRVGLRIGAKRGPADQQERGDERNEEQSAHGPHA